MIKDNVGFNDQISIKLITPEDYIAPRCGNCFANIGLYCARFGRVVTEFQAACDDYDKDENPK